MPCPADPLGGELDVGATGGQLLRHLPALPHGGALQHHAHPRVGGPEAADQPGHEPRAQAEREGERDHAALGVDQLVDGGEAVVEGVDQAVDVPLEGDAGVRHPQHPAGAAQQGGTDLLLEAGEGPRDPGLAHTEDVTDLGDRVAVGHELEPAERIGVHIHDDSRI